MSVVSVIVPVYNEAESLEALHHDLTLALERLVYELVFVDDGSTDESYAILRRLHEHDPHVRVIRLGRNFGQHAALTAGLELAKGDILVSFDADLQFDPADIPRLVARIEDGYDVVSGCRNRRDDGFFRRALPSLLVSWSMRLATGRRLKDPASPLKAVRAELVRGLEVTAEMRRFLGAVVLRLGRRVAEVPVMHRPRRAGQSKYTFLDLVAGYVDFVTAFFPRAFQMVGLVGLASLLFGAAGAAAYVMARLLFDLAPLHRAQFQVAVLLASWFGIQCLILGLLGELTSRIYRLVQDRPLYAVREVLG